MFFAGSMRLTDWLDNQSTGLLEQIASAGVFDDTLPTLGDGSVGSEPLDDERLGRGSAEQLEMLPMADWTPDEIMLLQSFGQ